MALYYYRGIEFVKNYIVKYLDSIFYAEEKGQIAFLDGTKKIDFERRPAVQKKSSWDTRPELPAILIGQSTGSFAYMSVSSDFLEDPETGSTDSAKTYRTYGGEIRLTTGIEVLASSKPDRNNMADIVGIYLSHPDAKLYFQQHNIVLPEGPSVNGESEEHHPNIDYPYYKTAMSLRTVSVWQDREESGESLLDIITRITAEEEL